MSTAEKLAEHLAGHIALQADRIRAELAAGLTSTSNALRVQGAMPRPLPARSSLLYGGPGRLVGWSVQATGGPVRLILHDGRDESGDVLAVIDLADQENDTQFLGGGVSFGEALYAERTGAGTLTGSAHLGVVD